MNYIFYKLNYIEKSLLFTRDILIYKKAVASGAPNNMQLGAEQYAS